jgi:pyridoxine 5-phosphate synthase
MKFIEDVRPAQATLVPDSPEVLTSNSGWDTQRNNTFLRDIIAQIKELGIRTSIFLDPIPDMVKAAEQTGTDRIELYTERYAKDYPENPEESIISYQEAAKLASEYHLGLNAGHDLDLNNLAFFHQHIPDLLEVSIGHALICDALYYGLENTIQMYRSKLTTPS